MPWPVSCKTARLQVDRKQAQWPPAGWPNGNVNPRAQLRIAEHQAGHIGMAVESDGLPDCEADGLPDHALRLVLAAAGSVRRAGALFHYDCEARGIEHALCRRDILGLLKRNHVGIEAVCDLPHRGIVGVGARLTPVAVPLGEKFEIPRRQGERPVGPNRGRRGLRGLLGSGACAERKERNGDEEKTWIHRALLTPTPGAFNPFVGSSFVWGSPASREPGGETTQNMNARGLEHVANKARYRVDLDRLYRNTLGRNGRRRPCDLRRLSSRLSR